MGRLEGDTGVFCHFPPDYLEISSHTELEFTVSTRMVGWGAGEGLFLGPSNAGVMGTGRYVELSM